MNKITFTDGRTFTPSKIICVGRNYSAHIKEMESERTEEPVLFLKPNSSLCDITRPIPLLQNRGAVHHEIELALCISRTGSKIQAGDADSFIAGYGLALDLTLRDIQTKAKKAGLPWAVAKGFDCACPISSFVPKDNVSDVTNLELSLKINNKQRQHGSTAQMLFSIQEIVSFASMFYTLLEGDIILTGTPSGVGPLEPGDKIEASISHIAEINTICKAG